MLNLRLLVVALVLLACAGCMQARQRYDGTGQSEQPAAPAAEPTTATELRSKRIVLFAPTAAAPLAKVYPAARLEFAFAMADRVDLLMKGHDGRVGEVLPDSDAARWNEGRVPATAGANVVVLTQILSIELVKGGRGIGSRPDRIDAVAELRALDVNGTLIYRKRAVGDADVHEKPKVVSDDGKPESLAAWDALDRALADFRSFISARNELADQPVRLTDQLGPEATLVPVIVDSDPAKADVLIDGDFRGTTPLTLKLPPRQVKVRIERQGFEPWERSLVPSVDMRIQPALVPMAAPVPNPAPAPAAGEEPPAG
jgi:hypothetical protein